MRFRPLLPTLAGFLFCLALTAPVRADQSCMLSVHSCSVLLVRDSNDQDALAASEQQERANRASIEHDMKELQTLYQPSSNLAEALSRRTLREEVLGKLQHLGFTDTRPIPLDQRPGYRWPDGSITPPSANPVTPLRSVLSNSANLYQPIAFAFRGDDTATYKTDADHQLLEVCPTHSGVCLVFQDGDGGPVTDAQLTAAEGALGGTRSRGTRDDGYILNDLINNLLVTTKGLIYYRFSDLATTSDHHFTGLFCAARADQEGKARPSWIGCASLAELKARRHLRPH